MLLTKFRLSFSVVISSIAGYLLATPAIDYGIVVLLLVGGYATVGASNAFNQWIEKERDMLMMRTRNRPLPAERMSKKTAFLIASLLSLLGIALLYLINIRTAFFCASFHSDLHLLVHPFKTENATLRICWSRAGSHSLYVGLGSRKQSFWYGGWGFVYDSVFLAIPSFLVYRMVFGRRLRKSWI